MYRAFVHRAQKAIFDILWATLLTKCDDLRGVDWQWQAADGRLGKARGAPESGVERRGHRGSASALTDRAESGVKKSLLRATLGAIVVERSAPTGAAPQRLCLDEGSDNAPAGATVKAAGYVRSTAHRRRETRRSGGRKRTRPAGGWWSARSLGPRAAAVSWCAATSSPSGIQPWSS